MTPTETFRGERDDLDARAAALVCEALRERASAAPHVVLGVVGGRSVGGIYARLKAMDLPWAKLHVFLADERLVPVTSDESNYKLVAADLLAVPLADGRLPKNQAHAFPFDETRADLGLSAYDEALRAVGGRFDVAVLSAGEDGHTASLFPGHPSVRAPGPGFVLVEESPKPPPRRISASRPLLERTGLGLMVFYGEGKRAALDKFEDPSTPVEQCPSKLISLMDRSVVLCDL